MNALVPSIDRGLAWLHALGHAVDLAIRLYVAQVFFRSGLLKIRNWDGTLYLFEHEYRVPVLSPVVAAWLGTFAELLFPVLLAFGLATRFAALSLSVFNVVAVVSFWHVLSDNESARMSHFYWGMLLLVPLCYGPGKLSIDHWIWRRISREGSPRQSR